MSKAFGLVTVEPHDFAPRSGLWNRLRGICNHCYAPRSLHPRRLRARARPQHDNRYYAASAPHFREGW